MASDRPTGPGRRKGPEMPKTLEERISEVRAARDNARELCKLRQARGDGAGAVEWNAVAVARTSHLRDLEALSHHLDHDALSGETVEIDF